ncbi:hypothetical protein BRPE64_CCDS05220 [Caballeronia insecticola]|uniref:Uncharacterized protein n=1 Tax=Caballeronia insecticola TaxID=758793 RepID=R4WYL1_9BURK|nr:hypothetical protein BRPE64_CCDS05220 [Caballeronia insecticola]
MLVLSIAITVYLFFFKLPGILLFANSATSGRIVSSPR